jgi:hypothetical protein
MTNFQTLRKIEKIEMLFNTAKEFAISLGANEESFVEAEAQLKELKNEFLKRVSGGIVRDSVQNSQIEGGEYIISQGPNQSPIP